MKKETLVLILLVDIFIVSSGFWGHYIDLWRREYKPIKVEYYVFGYRPIYMVKNLVTRGSWTLDFLQVCILIAALTSLILWFRHKHSPLSFEL